MSAINLDLSTGDYEPISPGFYRFEVTTVHDTEIVPNRWYQPSETHPVGQPYEDEKGYPVYPTRTRVRIDVTPIADADGAFDEEEQPIYTWHDLNVSKYSGKLRPSKSLRELMVACGGQYPDLKLLMGEIFWATVTNHPDTSGAIRAKVQAPTAQGPTKRRRARQEPPQAAPERARTTGPLIGSNAIEAAINQRHLDGGGTPDTNPYPPQAVQEAVYEDMEDEPGFSSGDDAAPADEQALVDQINAINDPDYLGAFTDYLRKDGQLTGSIRMQLQRRATALRQRRGSPQPAIA